MIAGVQSEIPVVAIGMLVTASMIAEGDAASDAVLAVLCRTSGLDASRMCRRRRGTPGLTD